MQPLQAQPTPEMESAWEKIVDPQIKMHFQKELVFRHATVHGHTKLMARAYLKKNGLLKNLRIDEEETESNLPLSELKQVKDALLLAIRASAPFQYASVPDSSLPHMGFFVKYDSVSGKFDAGLTRPEDYSGT